MSELWSKERAWNWYNARPWIMGCNFMGSDCANHLDQWQEYGFEEKMVTAEREMALAAETGFNSIRIFPKVYVWKYQHDGFMERFERYIETAYRHGLTTMVVLGNDCMPPKEEFFRRHYFGEHHVDWGYHGGRKVSQHGHLDTPGYSFLDDPECALWHYEFVEEIVTKYKNDERIIMWDVFNEPGNSRRGTLSLPHMKKYFEIIRRIDPIQPLTAAIWSQATHLETLPEVERYALEHSDIVSFHNYSDYLSNIEEIQELKKLGRPIINTEWLHRCNRNTVEALLPLFWLEKIGCYNWGLVAGKHQTYEPWNGIWDGYRENPGAYRDFDFTLWQHDLFRPNLNPYNPREIDLIRHICKLAGNEWKK